MTEKEKLIEEKLQTEAQLRKAKNDLKALEAEEKQLLRKQRSHRIFTRGGMLEAFLLEPLLLTDKQVHDILLTAFRQPMVGTLLKTMIENAKRGQAYEETR